MRRAFAVVLLCVFVLQSSGAASADPVSRSSVSLVAQISLEFGGVLASLEATYVGALLTGNANRWAEMHAPAPTPIPRPTMLQPYRSREIPHVAPYVVAPGFIAEARNAPALPVNLAHIPLDHRAMASPSLICTGVDCGTPMPRPTPTPTSTPTPAPTPTPTPAPTPTPTPAPTPTPCPAGWSGTPPNCIAPTASPAPSPTPSPSLASATTGINRWWTYEEQQIPGIGKALVNVANGNLVVVGDDTDVKERAIDLAFQRVYNSQSQHDSANSDNSVTSLFGNGWTNTFDAHIAYTPSINTISVYDIDGARYDYTANSQGGWNAPPGMQGTTLAPNGNCYYDWIKKNGTTYEFYVWNYSGSTCGGYAGQNGRISKIWERNSNNWVRFNYRYDGSGTTSNNISEIDALHQDGHQLTLSFADWSGHRELSSITRPNSHLKVTYWYDGNGNLTDVCEPANGSATVSNPCTAGQLHHQYAYTSGTHQLAWVNSPNWVMTNYECGTYQSYQYDNSNRVISLADNGTINPYIADGTQGTTLNDSCVGGTAGRPLQSSATGEQNYTVDYGNTQTQYLVDSFGGYGTGTTSLTDSEGHSTKWSIDGSGRVTQTQALVGGSSWIITSASWNSQNDLIESADARGNITDYAYDSNGNTIAIALPAVNGVRPTSLYSYDVQTVNGIPVNYNNITAYCDPATVGSSGYDWINRPQSDSLCTASTAQRFVWDHSDPYETYGRLSDSYGANGYHTWYAYSTSAQGGDFGLPSDVNSACVSQSDGSQRCAHQHFSYDPSGNLTSYSAADNQGTWALTYDELNRLITATDPTNVTSYKDYNDNGSVSMIETAYQHATNTGQTQTYDADGNVISQSASHGGTFNSNGSSPTLSGRVPTYKFYDGADRLVEVVQRRDSADVYTSDWVTRYVYDISGQGASAVLSFRGQELPHPAYGNLWKTQEWLPSAIPAGTLMSANSITPDIFADQKAQAFDALDRVLTKIQLVNNGTTDAWNSDSNTYDAGGYTGLLSQACNALSQCSNYAYDSLGRTMSVSFTDGTTPARNYGYDLDSRTISVSNIYGTQSYNYDSYGRLASSAEGLTSANGVTLTDSATITYHYYEDGKRSALDVATSGSNSFSQTSLFAYAYRADGALQWQQINDGSVPGFVGAGTTALSMTYDNVGRLIGRSESGVGANLTPITVTYNGYGMATTKAYPGGTLSNIQYDAGGAPLGYASLPAGQSTQQNNSYNYTVRGELSNIAPYGSAATRSTFANGIAFNASNCWCASNPYKTIDTAMAVTLASSNHAGGSGGANESDSSTGFDQAGRMTDESTTQTDSNMEISAQTDAQRQYDAENHIIKETYTSMNGSGGGGDAIAQYAWGPIGHPAAIGSSYSAAGAPPSPNFDTLHWDADELLFTTNQQGNVDDIKVGDLADITPAYGIVFYDRGAGSDVSFCHSATAVGGKGSASPYSRTATKFGTHASNPCGLMSGTPSAMLWSGDPNGDPSQSGVGNGGILAMPRGDGISDGYNTIQGVRSFSSESGVWTAPDAFSGMLVDPATQKSYMWNGNNPVSYEDPSGYNVNQGWDEYEYDFWNSSESLGSVHTGQQGSASNGNASAPSASGNQSTSLVWPVAGDQGGSISQGFATYNGYDPYHPGIDIAAPEGTKVVAANSGVIQIYPNDGAAGNAASIKSGNLMTVYMHMEAYAPGIKSGQHVKEGQLIGYVGTTGHSTGSHLHFETVINGVRFNPAGFKWIGSHPSLNSLPVRCCRTSLFWY